MIRAVILAMDGAVTVSGIMAGRMIRTIAVVRRVAGGVLAVLGPVEHGTDQLAVGETFWLGGAVSLRFNSLFHSPPLERATLLEGYCSADLEDCEFRSKNFAVKLSQG